MVLSPAIRLSSSTTASEYTCWSCRTSLNAGRRISGHRQSRYSHALITSPPYRASQSTSNHHAYHGKTNRSHSTHRAPQNIKQCAEKGIGTNTRTRQLQERGYAIPVVERRRNSRAGNRPRVWLDQRYDNALNLVRLCTPSYYMRQSLGQISRRHRTRSLHTALPHRQYAALEQSPEHKLDPGIEFADPPPGGIRDRLRQWQLQHLHDVPTPEIVFPEEPVSPNDPGRNYARLGNASSSSSTQQNTREEDTILAKNVDTSNAVEVPSWYVGKGDLVYVSGHAAHRSILGVVVRCEAGAMQIYTSQGRWELAIEEFAQFYIPRWASEKLVDPLLPYLPKLDARDNPGLRTAYGNGEDLSAPREFGQVLVSQMAAFERESQEIYRKHATSLDSAHMLLSHDHDLRYGSLTSVAMYLLQVKRSELTPVALYTVRLALNKDSFAFADDKRSHRATGFLQIRSKQQHRAMTEVALWCRRWQDEVVALANHPKAEAAKLTGVIPDFVRMARSLILESRKTRMPNRLTAFIGPSSIVRKMSPTQDAVDVVAGTPFSISQRKIVAFLEAHACSMLFSHDTRLRSYAPLILKAIGLYDHAAFDVPMHGTRTIYLLLQELGVLLPYENRHVYSPILMLPSSRHSRPLVELQASLMIEAKDGFQFEDSMKSLRHDWGMLPVYCIDGDDAHEIDDGISIEPKEYSGESWKRWVRLHIANPTAFLTREMPISRMARHMGETVYSPDRSHMMLSPRATRSYWSLAPRRPTLSISALMDQDGKILELDIRPGRITIVKRISPEKVTKILDPDGETPKTVEIVVGGDVPIDPETRRTTNLTPADVQNLVDLSEIAALLSKQRAALGGLNIPTSRNDVTVWTRYDKQGLAYVPLSLTGSRRIEGDPVIRMRTQATSIWLPWSNEERRDGNALVQEMMLLAAQVAARWCAERQMPALYRGTRLDGGGTDVNTDHAKYMEEVINPVSQKNNGRVPRHLAYQMLHRRSGTVVSTVPIKHNVLGQEYYTKVTSPLRRYGDMIIHWQIEAALREEARTGQSLVTTDAAADRSFLPFSRSTLEAFMIGYQSRELTISHVKQESLQLWENMCLARAFHYGQARMPFDTFHVLTSSASASSDGRTRTWANGMLVELNKHVRMYRDESDLGTEVREGDVWECTLLEVDPFERQCAVKAIRLLHRWEDTSPSTVLP